MKAIIHRVAVGVSRGTRALPASSRMPFVGQTRTNWVRGEVGPPYGAAYRDNDIEYAVEELGRELEDKFNAKITKLEARIALLETKADIQSKLSLAKKSNPDANKVTGTLYIAGKSYQI